MAKGECFSDVLNCLSGNNSYTDGVGCTNACTSSAWPSSGQERHSSTDSLNIAQAGEAVLNEVNLYWTSAFFHLKGRHNTHTERCPKFLPLLADGFHWAQFSHKSKLKLEKTQQQGKVPSSHSTSSLTRDIFDNSVPFFPN